MNLNHWDMQERIKKMKKNDTVLIKATVDATRKLTNTKQIRVKIGDDLVWIDEEDVIETGMVMIDEGVCDY